MKYDFKKILKVGGIFIGIFVITGYALFQAKNIITGPTLSIESPYNGATLTEEAFVVKGFASNIASISLNDSPIFINENGLFEEKLIAPIGYSIMKLSVADRFGRRKTQYIQLIRKENKSI